MPRRKVSEMWTPGSVNLATRIGLGVQPSTTDSMPPIALAVAAGALKARCLSSVP